MSEDTAKSVLRRRRKRWHWCLLLLILAAAGLAYYLYIQKDRLEKAKKQEVTVQPETPMAKKPKPKKPETAAKEPETPVVEKKEIPPVQEVQKETPPEQPKPEQDFCKKIEKDMADFFQYLDQKPYVKKLDPKPDTHTRFKRVLKLLAERPPTPAGEGKDPKIMVGNIYHFFRVLRKSKKDLQLIRLVLRNEKDSMEYNLKLIYTWITLGDRCPDPEGVRPSGGVTYQYAAFFLTTTGGRAYLLRRSMGIRLLVTYYSLLIAHAADKNGANAYGIDVWSHLKRLKKEMGLYPDFYYQDTYLARLKRMETYYLAKRKSR